MKKVAILQSNYIPWKGYFDLMNQVDDFVVYDCVQYTKNDWRNRNQIKSKNGLQWLTIPVSIKKSAQLISETEVVNTRWADKHLKTISQVYAKSEYFCDYIDELKGCYDAAILISFKAKDWCTTVIEPVDPIDFGIGQNYIQSLQFFLRLFIPNSFSDRILKKLDKYERPLPMNIYLVEPNCVSK